MIGNCWVRKCWQPIKEPVNREDYGDRFTWKPNLTKIDSINFDDTLRLLYIQTFTWKPNLTEVYSINFDVTLRLLIFSNIQSFDLVLDQLTVSRTITIVTSPAYKIQLFIRDLEFSYFFAFQSVCIWNCSICLPGGFQRRQYLRLLRWSKWQLFGLECKSKNS